MSAPRSRLSVPAAMPIGPSHHHVHGEAAGAPHRHEHQHADENAQGSGHAHGADAEAAAGMRAAPPRRRVSLIALAGWQRLLLVLPVIGLIWALAFWAMDHG